MINRRFAFILALLFSLSGLAASNYEKGLKAFLENDRDDAIDHLEESIQDGKMVPESHLLLCLTYSIIENTPATFMHFKAFIASAKDPYPYVAALWGSSETGLGAYKKDNERLEFLEELINTPALPGKLRAMCFDALCRHYKAVGDFEKAREQSLQIGAIQNWSSVGPFENISASGFKKNFGAVEHPEPTYSFKSKYGASVKWFETKGPQIEQWMKNYYSFHAFNALVYSQTFIQSPKKQKVQIRLGVGGSVKLWLNDHLIYSETDERDNDIDSHVIEVELAKGKNRILIQVGEADNDKSEFFVRITDEDGLPVNGITSDAFGTKYSTDKPEFKVLRNYEEAYFEDLVKEDPSLMNRIMLAKSYARNDNRYLARKTLNKAIMEAPNSSYLQLSLAFVYMSEGNRTGIATIISWLKRNDLKNPVSLSLTFNEALGNENYQTADSILDIYVSEYGATASYYEDAIELAIDQEDNSQLFYLIESAYDLYSDNATFVRYKSLIHFGINKKYWSE
jgi:hypothetical protein